MGRWKSEILIGKEVIWSAEEAVSQQRLSLDVSRFTGNQDVTFRLRRKTSPVTESLWENWWYFNGTTDYLEMAHNSDFDVPDGDSWFGGSWVIGFRDEEESPSSGNRVLVAKGQADYSGSGNGDFSLYNVRGAGTQHRPRWKWRDGGGTWRSVDPNDSYNEDADCVSVVARNNTQDNITTFIDDDVDCDGGGNTWWGGNSNYNGTSPIIIGAEKREDGGSPTYRYYFKGRIYFAAWMLSTTTRWADSTGALCLSDRSYIPWYDTTDRKPEQQHAVACWWFNKPVTSTYSAEIASGPNAPYTFNVNGSPVLNGGP
jgi:hypothetical protein